MNDTPGWTSPGSAPSDGQEPGASGPAGRPATGEPADRPSAEPTSPGTKWSKEQPPPGQWSAPTGPGQTPPPPPPHPGWGAPPPPPGGYGGQGRGYGGPGGYGWGGPPPAAKPGVIPLRPLGVGEILDGAVSTMRTHWRTVLGISLTVAIFTEIIVVLLQGLVLDNTSSDALNDPDATLSELADALTATTVNSGVIFLISLIGTVVATALLTTVTSRAVLGRPVTTREAWRDARPQVIKLFGLIVLLLLMVAGILLVAMLPGLLVTATAGGEGGVALTALGFLAGALVAVWLMVRFSLASPALMLEKQGIKKAMGRSTKLVKGSWWRVFGIQLLATVIANIVASIIVIPFTFLAAALSGDGVSGFLEGGGDLGWTFLVVSGVGSVIGSMITFPITAGVTVLLYIDQRIRREALDLELARAAGIQGPGSPGAVPGS
ncbi:glycerophosphoryl diester phosphodiesterase membrane domain-containing protein [Streptomyces flaveolus]|uniref:glycerophosphoryl diester phosphodiesterase membrane domain-containing protein n=1 Tax=Streptomyces flaveolus TaxID=67297 RepID=UPI00166F75FE|nr:glycerophosphoryl diester phosphodiesterase membrane domain-containing protein [Streptomyces flaveolus]GGQ70254.1 membrane protein [Streptomyces flaveolus]